ncbi:hypothetical protein [Pseudomonas sp. FW305-70]|uniref:hypothetical protein n=1 Tax=Pseudomonas sp. FW305-70 TaxID=2751342 RepID=UPI000C884AF2|nr:hypothetical protein [Pseudomonas sp. FW305-70]PMZ74905.1 hypothetical protein C1X65_15030 [Pseudomonas sp. FW305-70]
MMELLTKYPEFIERYSVTGFPEVIVARAILNSATILKAEEHYSQQLLSGNFQVDRLHQLDRLYFRDDSFGLILLREIEPLASEIIGVRLNSLYSFASYYRRGANLLRHYDRDECELTVGFRLFDSTVDSDSSKPYLSFGSPTESTDVIMTSVDAAMFYGAITPHWRAQLNEDYLCTLLLHYRARLS